MGLGAKIVACQIARMTAQAGALLDRQEPPRQLEPDWIFELRNRGCSGVVTTATCKLPLQYDVALVEWRQHSINAA